VLWLVNRLSIAKKSEKHLGHEWNWPAVGPLIHSVFFSVREKGKSPFACPQTL
jgi:hypothetical protein